LADSELCVINYEFTNSQIGELQDKDHEFTNWQIVNCLL